MAHPSTDQYESKQIHWPAAQYADAAAVAAQYNQYFAGVGMGEGQQQQQLHGSSWQLELRVGGDENQLSANMSCDHDKLSGTPTKPTSSTRSPLSYIPPSSIILFKKVGAEFIGTFLLIFAAEGAAIMNERTKGSVTLIGVGLAAGLAAMILILSIGHISGAHLNPVATIAFATIKEFRWSEVPFYVITQLVASIFAAAALKVILNYDGEAGLTVPVGTPLQAFLVEFIITFLLMFVATAVSTDSRAVGELAGIAVGATVLLNNLLASALTGASMNPVRTLGPAIVANNYKLVWVYIIGPIIGGVTGSGTYTLMRFNHLNDSQLASQVFKKDDLVASQVFKKDDLVASQV